jgi:hypothetical protein
VEYGVNFSAQDFIVISAALIGVMYGAWLFVAAVHHGHRPVRVAAAIVSFGFGLAAVAYLLGGT